MTRIGIAAALVCLGFGASASSGSEPRPGERARYPTFGVAFEKPKGWVEQIRDKGKTMVRWISPDSAPENPVAMIRVECGRTPARSLDEVAQGLAQTFHGVVSDRPTTLGGTRTLRVLAKSDDRTLRPVEGLATIHDGLLYLVMGGVTAGHSVADQVEAIRASWSWMPIEPLYNHLEFHEKPLSLSGGAATINVPALMHTYSTEHPDRILDLGLHNVLRNEADFLVYAQIVSMAERRTFDEIKNQISENLRAQCTIKGPIEWRAPGNDPARAVSQVVEVEMTDKASGRKQKLLVRWALVRLDDRRLISVNFTLPPEAPRSRSIYIPLVDRIVDSIQPGVGDDQAKEREKSGRRGA